MSSLRARDSVVSVTQQQQARACICLILCVSRQQHPPTHKATARTRGQCQVSLHSLWVGGQGTQRLQPSSNRRHLAATATTAATALPGRLLLLLLDDVRAGRQRGDLCGCTARVSTGLSALVPTAVAVCPSNALATRQHSLVPGSNTAAAPCLPRVHVDSGDARQAGRDQPCLCLRCPPSSCSPQTWWSPACTQEQPASCCTTLSRSRPGAAAEGAPHPPASGCCPAAAAVLSGAGGEVPSWPVLQAVPRAGAGGLSWGPELRTV